jgi:phosphate acetyltransferase
VSRSLYLTATESKSGKSAVALCAMRMLMAGVQHVAVFRPIINDPQPGARDHDIDLLLAEFALDIPYERTYAHTLEQARELLNSGRHATLLENILQKFKQLQTEYEFVLCLGTDFTGKDAAFEFDLNADIASNLGAPVLLVVSGKSKANGELVASTQMTIDTLEEKGVEIVAVIVNRFTGSAAEADEARSNLVCRVHCALPLLVYLIPEDESLGNPTINDVRKWMDARVLYGQDRMETLVEDYVVAAMHIANFLEYLQKGSLVITPGDRSDIILGSLASRLSPVYPDIAGILLTGGIEPSPSVHRLIEGWTDVPLPVLLVQENTFKAARRLLELHGRIFPDDVRKIATAQGLFDSNVNTEELRQRVVTTVSTRVTPKMFEFALVERAAADKQHIVLPEGRSDRILQAADILVRRGVGRITILGDPDELRARASALGVNPGDGVELLDPAKSPFFDDYVQTYFELRKHKGIRLEDAHDRMLDPTYFSTMMVHKGHADGMVSGSITTTGQTIRPAFEFIKTRPGFSVVSSVFLMCLKDRVLVFGDCAVNPNPDANQLAEIALSSAHTARVFGIEPRVAMLSYSTGKSGKGEDVDKVVQATRIAQEREPDLLLEGPLQYDAAIDPEVAATKLPDSRVAGRATVFIFPDLNTGNNTYKAVQRAAGAVAIGPVLQGLNKPVNDLSRGCTVPDIVNTVAITAIQAQAQKQIPAASEQGPDA